jgi:hypothetical protein
MPRANITFRCEPDLKRAVIRLAKASDIGLSKYIIGVLTNAVKTQTVLREKTTFEEIRGRGEK